MSLLNILTYPDPLLRKKARNVVDVVNDDVRKLIDNMLETMYAAKGIGLASIQVGDERRIIVLDVPDKEDFKRGDNLVVLVNPEIIKCEGETSSEEGCLSVPGINADVKRFYSVNITGLNREGENISIEAQDLQAIAFQHEVDHLEGILFIDRISRIKRALIKSKLKKALG